MKFLSDILAKAGLTVDGVVTLNNTATGQTPDANDNSTKLATTAWVRGFVTPYTLPIASGTTLGGIKIGSGLSIDGTGIVSVAASGVGAIRALQQLTATAGQTVFTVSGGYTPGLIDVFLNGVLLTPTAIDSSNGNTFTLADGAIVGDLLDVFVYNPIYNGFISSTDQVPEGDVNLYYTDARARAAISLTTNGNSGAATYIAGVLNIPNYQGLVPAGGVAGDILAKVSGTNYDVTWIPNYTSQVQHIVKAAVAVTKGQAVYVSSSDGTNMIVSKASNAAEQTSSKTLGLVAQDLALNGQGFVVTEGLLAGLDTSTAQAGDPVWLGTNGNLIFGLVNKPVAPAHLVFIGIVTRVQSNNGEIFVKVQNGFELDELHDLSVKNASDGDMIKYVASTGLWTKIAATTTNITEGTNLYYTDTRARAAISVTGSGSYDSVTGIITVTGGVTSVNTLTGAVTLTTSNIAEGTNLYYTDARVRLAISLTTTGTSGAATYDNVTGVLNIPQYQGGVTSFNTRTGAITLSSTDVTTALTYTPVTNARTITINGTGYDLSADRTWTIAAGLTSFNTRTGDITLTSTDITDALGFTPASSVSSSARTIQTYTATANQTTFTVTGGYVAGLVDVYINGIKLAVADYTATNGTTVVLATGTGAGNIVEVVRYNTAFTATNALRQITEFTATAGQTTFTVSYSPGLVDVFYNGSKLASSEYTASNGTSIVLATTAVLNDTIEVVAYSYAVGAYTGQAQLNGTGFVKVNGTTVSYDNSTYLTTSSASSSYVPYSGATNNIALGNYNLSLTDLAVNTIYANNNGQNDIGSSTGNKFRNIYANSFVKTGGTSSQFLKADGSVDSTTYAPSNFYVIDYLVVAGGGGGGGAEMSNGYGGGGAGGGAGGYLASTTGINVGSSYTVIVGAGGAGGASRLAADGSGLPGSNGGYSQIFHTVCLGGGQGQGDETGNGTASASLGGSGGGCGGDNSAGPGSGTTGQGNSGGSRGTTRSGGGGGGANTPGGTSVDGSRGGLGGNGLSWFDTNIYSCGGGGGGGGAVVDNAAGGNSSINGGRGSRSTGGGGTTGEPGGQATPGTANTGTGGGGAGAGYLQGGQNGGSGIVIIRYAGAQRGTGGTVTSSGGYTYHRFTSSGIFTA